MDAYRSFGLLVLCLLALAPITFAQPVNISTMTTGTPETKLPGIGSSSGAQGGNHSEVNMSGQTQTQFWQGLWGQIDVSMTLMDAAGNVFYNWSRFNISAGEVYFTNQSLQVFDHSITNATDRNITYAQLTYNWANSSGADNFTSTYNRANGHQQFSFSTSLGTTLQINASTAPSLKMENGLFNSTVLWDSDAGGYPLWVAIVNPDRASFIAGRGADFEILLPVRGASVTERFYVYAEIQ